MSIWTYIAIACAGGVGAGLRFVIDTLVSSKTKGDYPYGTSIINVSGSFALGLLLGAGVSVLGPQWIAILGTGLLGGFTTFSTASFETVRLIQNGSLAKGLLHGLGGLATCVVAALLGLLIAI